MLGKLGGALLLSSVLCMSLWAQDEDFFAGSKQLEVLKSVSDCSVYLAVRKHTRARYRELLVAKQKIKEIAKQRREALGLCGAPTEDSRRALQDERIARQCPKEFSQWIKISENYLNNQFEIKESYRNLQSLAGIINYYCGEVPEVLEKLPLEKPPEEKLPEEKQPVQEKEDSPPVISAPPRLEVSPHLEPLLPDLFIEGSPDLSFSSEVAFKFILS